MKARKGSHESTKPLSDKKRTAILGQQATRTKANDNTGRMLFSLPRVFVVMVFALVNCGMAAPTQSVTPTSLDDRVKELAMAVNNLALDRSKDVAATVCSCCEGIRRTRAAGTRALCASDAWRARLPSVDALASRRAHTGEQIVCCCHATVERSWHSRAVRI